MNRREFLKTGPAAATAVSLGTSNQAAIPPSDRITVGVLGAGARAQGIMDEIMAIPEAEIVAVCDAYSGRLQRAQERTGGRARTYDQYQEVLNREDVDVVLIGSPDHWHCRMTLDALDAGKDVYVEKPMTYTIDEGLKMIGAVRKTQRILTVGSQGISARTSQEARRIVQEGKLGQITLVRATFNRNSAGGAWIYPIPPDASPETVRWEQFLGDAPWHPFSLERFFRWRCYRDYSGGISTDLFVHLVTTIHFVTGAKMPATVLGSGQLYRWKESRDVPDTLNAILVYPEGFTANLSATFNNESGNGGVVSILGTEGTLTIEGGEVTLTPEKVSEDNHWVVRAWPRQLEEAYYSDPEVRKSEILESRPARLNRPTQTWSAEGRDATYLHFANFLEAVRSRQDPVEDVVMGHRAASCAHLINLSAETNRMVSWDFEKETLKT